MLGQILCRVGIAYTIIALVGIAAPTGTTGTLSMKMK